jgi:hypothetical protein
MSRFHHVPQVLAVACCVGAVPGSAGAQKIPAACQPLIAAERKVIITPHHVYMTEGSARPGDKGRTIETITAGGVSYVQTGGTWRRSPWTVQQALAQIDTNLTTTTAYSCTHVGDESVAGTPATVYTAHAENEGVKTDTRAWVAKGSGLILRTEEDMDVGGGGKRHMSIRYEYTNVQAPAGVK